MWSAGPRKTAPLLWRIQDLHELRNHAKLPMFVVLPEFQGFKLGVERLHDDFDVPPLVFGALFLFADVLFYREFGAGVGDADSLDQQTLPLPAPDHAGA